MKPYARSDRVAGLIKQILAELLTTQISDPRLATATITAVKLSRDLRIAKIYFTIHGDESVRRAAGEGFKRARGFFKRELAQQLDLRYMPDLVFYYDDSIDYGEHIEKLLKTVKKNETDT